ncbi:sugar phosphate isomerase/epimerase family protein [Aureimonas leprariae]|uniref:Sugar phosphate isomerase/epimerase n=1 Tax=Plantimonas leprariae TaxID=2615207 RepID=A0A7V7PLS6_9HYPH|nr:sugar phosphate isomerase/epimerase [Aureimonas leprariae]KAB0677547.1 sugar phosphate isomerase/epimerase [Aureimonas leprariae]
MTAPTLSIQLYSLRSLGGLERQLDAAAAAGFRSVETIGSHLDDAGSLKRALAERGLDAPSGHVGIAALRQDAGRVAAAAGEVGITQLFMPAFPSDERSMDADGWTRAGAELGAIAETLQARGVALGYHNHHWEFARLEGGKRPLDCLFEGAKGSPLIWQADIAWIARGGEDAATWLAKYRSALASAHVKDQAPAGENEDEDGWCDVGAGTLDWPTLWEKAAADGAKLMVVEHDNPKDPAGFASRSFRYLERFERTG